VTAINRQPTGWLGFLGIKNFGRNPTAAADTLAPTWDLAALYLAQPRIFGTTANTPTGLGLLYASFTVPPAQVWHVESFGIISAPLATTTVFAGVPVIFYSPTSVYVPLQHPDAPKAIGTVFATGISRPIILAAGQSIGYLVTDYAAPNPSITQSIVYTVLDA